MIDAPDGYVALRERAALVAMPWLDRLAVVGSDRVDFRFMRSKRRKLSAA